MQQRHIARPHPAGSKNTETNGCIVLVVEDDLTAAHCLAAIVEMMGHEVHLAFDGLRAVEAAASYRPDLILMDIGLPKLDGCEAARRIRRLPGGRDALLVALTGSASPEDQDRTAAAGFDRHLVKPADLAELEQVLEQLCASPAH